RLAGTGGQNGWFGVVLPLLGSTMIAIVIPTAVLIIAAGPEPWYTARYVVPLAGMVLGNSLRGNIIALDTFRHTLETERELYAARLFSGATPAEAMRPVIARSLAKSLAPTIATTATIGLVSLPGMMTGQILGGAVPFTAIRYQIAIMLAIFASVSLAAVLNIVTARHLFFDQFDMPCFD
ncbi:MAG: ABC transporter permease, partial [Alkalispirochaeta sp.]